MILLNKETRGAAQKDFTLNPKAPNGGLCLGTLVGIDINKTDIIAATSPMKTYIGKSLPRLVFTFKEYCTNTNDEAGIYQHGFLPIDLTQDKHTMFENAMAIHLVHYLDAFDINRDNINLTLTDSKGIAIDETAVTVDELIESWTRFFETYIALFTKGEIVIYKDVLLWIKLLLYNGNYEVNNGRPGFTIFINSGIIEKAIKDKTPSISINKARGEYIEPREKVLNNPTLLPNLTGGIPIPDFL